MPEVPGRRFELVRGELIEAPGTGALHNLVALATAILLSVYVRERDLGVVRADGASYVLARDPDTVRIPDVSFVARERIPGGVPVGYWPFAPDLAVEIVSPHDRAGDVQVKVREYLEAGTRSVWVLWPGRRSITVHETDGIGRELSPDDELDGGNVLPGSRVRVGELFEIDGQHLFGM